MPLMKRVFILRTKNVGGGDVIDCTVPLKRDAWKTSRGVDKNGIVGNATQSRRIEQRNDKVFHEFAVWRFNQCIGPFYDQVAFDVGRISLKRGRCCCKT